MAVTIASLRSRRAMLERRFDLADLDAVAADLDLMIGAAEEGDRAESGWNAPRSPVRYIRDAAVRSNGFGTNFSARSGQGDSGSRAPGPGRRRRFLPGTPTGTGFRSRSRMWISVLAIGRPIGADTLDSLSLARGKPCRC